MSTHVWANGKPTFTFMQQYGSLFLMMVVAGVVMIIMSKRSKNYNPKKNINYRNAFVCLNCENISRNTKKIIQGSLTMEIGLWIVCLLVVLFTILPTLFLSTFLLLIPLVYSLSRAFSTRKRQCYICGGSVVPASSPRGKEILARHLDKYE